LVAGSRQQAHAGLARQAGIVDHQHARVAAAGSRGGGASRGIGDVGQRASW
jgi:hypothetical protein